MNLKKHVFQVLSQIILFALSAIPPLAKNSIPYHMSAARFIFFFINIPRLVLFQTRGNKCNTSLYYGRIVFTAIIETFLKIV